MATIEIHGGRDHRWMDFRCRVFDILNNGGLKNIPDVKPSRIIDIKDPVVGEEDENQLFLRVYFEPDEPRTVLGRLKKFGLRIEVKYLDQVISAPVAGKEATRRVA